MRALASSVLLLMTLGPFPLSALQSPAPVIPPTVTVSASRTDAPPSIDGLASDPIWSVATRIGGFTQVEPDEGAAPSHPTEFQVAYDADNLYVLVRAFDPDPDSILRALSRRDVRGPSDQILVAVDSYHDRRTGYEFAVNPDGVKRDNTICNDGNRDSSWDGV
ncbi:MAG: carbohydrate binding family 9 domain-containing protein [Gemmatimonadota bacterium]